MGRQIEYVIEERANGLFSSTPVEQNHLKIDSEVNLAQELGNYGNVEGSADNFFNLDVNARQISLFSLRAAEINKNTPLGRLQRSV